MDTYKKWEILEELLTDEQLCAAHVLTDYSGFNHNTLDYLAETFEIDWEEEEEEEI